LPPARLIPTDGRIVFVGGLHRSGTTPLARWLGDHPAVSGLSGTGVHEDEGQHLQSVYPVAGAHGGAGRFALDPAARLTEASPLVSEGAAQRLIDAWAPFWDTSKPVLLEKSPPNLVRMRFLRALFPGAPFIIVIRHPIAVAVATSKWSRTGMDSLLRHWLAGHRHLFDDAAAVGNVAVVRYEDLTADPAAVMQRLFEFLSLASHTGDWPVRTGLNDAYFERFRSPRRPLRRRANAAVARRYENQVAPFGYSLLVPEELREPVPQLSRLMPASGGGGALIAASQRGARPPIA
jgi:sulfotransferase family protein